MNYWAILPEFQFLSLINFTLTITILMWVFPDFKVWIWNLNSLSLLFIMQNGYFRVIIIILLWHLMAQVLPHQFMVIVLQFMVLQLQFMVHQHQSMATVLQDITLDLAMAGRLSLCSSVTSAMSTSQHWSMVTRLQGPNNLRFMSNIREVSTMANTMPRLRQPLDQPLTNIRL